MDNIREFLDRDNFRSWLDFMYGKDTTDGKTDKQIEDQVNRDREKAVRIASELITILPQGRLIVRLSQYGDAIAKPKMNDNTFEVWRGNSLIDGAEIVVLMSGITRKSINGKTLDMIQISIVRTDVSPLEAVQTGLDRSICGDCKLREIIAKSENLENKCYL